MATALQIMSILLLVLTPLSYLPQYKTLLSTRNANGISVTAALMLALCAQSQIPTMYYLFACPVYKRDGSIIPTPPRLVDYLNLAQLLMQWLCSLLLLGLVLVVRESEHDDAEPNASTTDATTPGRTSPSAKTAIILLVVHAALCVFWAVLAGKPSRDWLDLPFVVIMSINYACINPLVTIATGVAYGLQASATESTQGRTALSRRTLVLQIVTFSALAVTWPIRFKMPQNLKSSSLWLVFDWYPLVGWACVNNAIIAVGQCFVLHAAGSRASTGLGVTGQESEPLLAT